MDPEGLGHRRQRAACAGLTDARVKRIAIANPKFAPYGRAAEAALRYEKVYDAVRGKLVLGENISQTAQLVDSGNASVGIIALSLALGPALRASGTYTEIPADRPSADRSGGCHRQRLEEQAAGA